MTTFYICEIETRHFSFDGFGVGQVEARDALMNAVKWHCVQYGASLADFLDYHPPAEWAVREVQLGHGYRDRELLEGADHG